MINDDKYLKRGVSSSKSEVHKAIQRLDKGIFPDAFCKVLPDIVGGDAKYCNIMHADTAGTKTSLAYIYWKETGDTSVWKGIVEDAIVMNIDDLACVGAVNDIVISSTIGRNKHLVPGEVLKIIIEHTNAFLRKFEKYGINLVLAGGETADVGDIVRSIDVGITAFVRMKRADVIKMQPQAGDIIVGFSSAGKAEWEEEYNGGMGSNGLTSARHDVFFRDYAHKYPESYDPSTQAELVYSGSKSLTFPVSIDEKSTIPLGKLVLSPTRTYLPMVKIILERHRGAIHGMVHCSGGGQTKIMKFIPDGFKVIKDSLMPTPPLFNIIRQESGTSLFEMYKVFNMGHRLEILCNSQATAQGMIDLAKAMGIDAAVIGRIEKTDGPKSLLIHAEDQELEYRAGDF